MTRLRYYTVFRDTCRSPTEPSIGTGPEIARSCGASTRSFFGFKYSKRGQLRVKGPSSNLEFVGAEEKEEATRGRKIAFSRAGGVPG
jgi:hypothetical protein